MFVGYVINLNQRVDRLTHFYQHADANYFQRVPAIDKAILNLVDNGRVDYFFNHTYFKHLIGRDVTVGEVACTLSHIQCWRLIAQHPTLNEHDFAVIAEDDIHLSPHFAENIQQLLMQIKSRPHINILILQHLFWSNIADLSLATGIVQEFKYLNSSQEQFFDFKSSALYAIKKSHAQALINHLSTHKPFWLADHFSRFCDVHQMCTVSPLLGVVPDGIDAESDLEAEREIARQKS